MNENNRIKLRDGRILGWAEYGGPGGRPLVFFHGWPSSRFAASVVDEAAKALNVRVVSPDRPGYGLSTFQTGRTLLDWPDDVLELVDALNKKICGDGHIGRRTVCCDLRMYTGDWGFDIGDIRARVFLWYGEDDKNVSVEMGKYYAAHIPNSRLTLCPHAGHRLLEQHAGEILKELVLEKLLSCTVT